MKNRMQFTNEGLDKMKRLSGLINETGIGIGDRIMMKDIHDLGLLNNVKTKFENKLIVGAGDSDEYVIIKSVEYNIPHPHEGEVNKMGKNDAWWDSLVDFINQNPNNIIGYIERDNGKDWKIISSNQSGAIYYSGGNSAVDNDY